MRKTAGPLVALLALLAALMAADTASANRLEFVMAREEIAAETTEATFTNAEAGISVRCRGRMNARYERIISKTSGSHIGNVTFEGATECRSEGTAATVTFLPQRSPWEMRYRSFAGTLPTISNVLSNIAQLEFLIRAQVGLTTIACLFRAEAEALITTEPGGIAYLAEAGARLVATLSGICPVTISLGGRYPFLAGSGLTMRLI